MKQTETLAWILYDIAADRARTKVAKLCKEAGLHRVQKSCFLGTIQRNRLDELVLGITDLIDAGADRVYVFPLCDPDFRKVQTLGQAFDPDLVTDEVKSLFL